MAECACASLIFTSFIDVPSWVCVDPKYLNWSTSSIALPFILHMLVDGLGLMPLRIILLLSELVYFNDVSSSSYLQSFSDLLEFGFTASQQIDVVSKLKWLPIALF